MKHVIGFLTLAGLFVGLPMYINDIKGKESNYNCQKIQIYWRKYDLRKKHNQISKIQRCWREYMLRVKSVSKIQNAWRARQARQKLQNLKKNISSSIIQTVWKRYRNNWFVFEKI